MPTTPLHLCHQCKKEIYRVLNPWTFHRRNARRGGKLEDVVRFCSVNCIAAYYKLAPAASLAPVNGKPADAPNS